MIYHLFIIKKEIYDVYKNKPYALYKLLYNLYNLNESDFSYGVSLYNQLCEPLNIKKVKKYFELLDKVRTGKNKYYFLENNTEHTIIIKPSHIIYRTILPSLNVLYILDNYSKYIFMCCFSKGEFYFICEKTKD